MLHTIRLQHSEALQLTTLTHCTPTPPPPPPEFYSTTQHQRGGGVQIPHPSAPPRPLRDWAKFCSRLSANQKCSLAPLAPVSSGQKSFLWPFALHYFGTSRGGWGVSPPPPPFKSPSAPQTLHTPCHCLSSKAK